MKRLILLTVAVVVVSLHALGQKPASRYAIAFYNLENLFDTIKSPGIMDEEFTPVGPKRWGAKRYEQKMENLQKVIYDLSATVKDYPAVIGMAEVENREVVEDLVSRSKLSKARYQVVHYDSPEARGIDVALIYRPDIFKYEGSNPISIVVPSLPNFKTREILSVWGTINGEKFCFLVCHWPSRRGGQASSDFKRIGAAQTVRDAADSIMRLRPQIKLVIMGDMNDEPGDQSLSGVIGAGDRIEGVKHNELYNPFHDLKNNGFGSTAYDGVWFMFDNMIVNGQLLHPDAGALRLVKSLSSLYYGNIFSRPWVLNPSGQYKGSPYRTYEGNTYIGGYSDHLPVYIFIGK